MRRQNVVALTYQRILFTLFSSVDPDCTAGWVGRCA